MTEPVPSIIAQNFIYSKIWNNVYRKQLNSVLQFCGAPGSGKSYAALKFCEDLDSSFNSERICFDLASFLKLLKDGDSLGPLKPGSCIVFDEACGSAEAGADSRRSMSKSNMVLSFLSTIYRKMRLIVIYISPLYSQIDLRIKSIGLVGVCSFLSVDFNRKVSKATWYWVNCSHLSGALYLQKQRVLNTNGYLVIVDFIFVHLPSAVLISQYEILKQNFIDQKIADWYSEVTAKPKERQSSGAALSEVYERIKGNTAAYVSDNTTGLVCPGILRIKEGLSQRDAYALAATLNQKKSVI